MIPLALLLLAAPANPEWNKPVEPFRIAENVYYVGVSNVTAVLVTTPKGHILIDTGFAETVPHIEASMKKLGFRVSDVRLLLASHAHYDHVGGIVAMKKLTGARLLVNPRDAGQYERGGLGDFAFGDKVPFDPVKPDGFFKDGETIRLGGIEIVAHFTPGHTRGNTTYTIKTGGKDVVFAGSLTAPNYQLLDNRAYPEIVSDYEKSFAAMRALPCDVYVLGHGREVGNAEGYRRFLDRSEAAFRKQLAEQRAATKRP